MRILVAPDKFAGTLTAAQAAAAIAEGWRRTAPDDECIPLPLSDGGPGFLDVLAGSLAGELRTVPVTGPLGGQVPARLLLVDGGGTSTAYVECADACGLHLVEPDRRDAEAASTFGVGELLRAAVGAGARRVVVGVGGTASTDGGAGMLAALGATPREPLSSGGGGLGRLDDDGGTVDLAPARAALDGVALVAATDIGSPLMGSDGAAHGYGAQKGADRAARERLEAAMRRWATATDGGVAVKAGAGAGGGLGFGLLLLGAERVPGAQLVLDAVGLEARAAEADVVVTGEGAFDWQSLRGKVVAGVTRAAQQSGRPVVVLAGRVEVGRRELSSTGIDAAYAVVDMPGRDEGHTPYEGLATLAARVARTWSR